jgi:arginine exporter protein ArgO
MSTSSSSTATTSRRTAVQTAALVVGVAFLVVGILGFIPGVTSDYDTMTFASHESDAALLGMFEVSVLHNIVHLLFGVLGVAMSRTAAHARSFLIGGGVVYLVLWLYGLFIDQDSAANFVPVNDADNWLHFVLGVGMIVLGFVLTRSRTRTANGAA